MASLSQSSTAMALPSPGAAAAANSASTNISASSNQVRRMRPISSSGKQPPTQRLASMKGCDAVDLRRHNRWCYFQRDSAFVDRQAVEAGAVDRREGL